MKLLRRSAFVVGGLAVLMLVVGGGWYLSARIVLPAPASTDHSDCFIAPSVDPDLAHRSRERLLALRRSSPYPAVSAAVAVDGGLVWAEAQGHADLKRGAPVNLETRFPIGSVSKPLTAVAAMQLVEQGRLDLDQRIRTYLPAFPTKRYPLTARQLLSHQAGVRHYRRNVKPPLFSEMALDRQFDTVTQSLELFAHDPLLFEPDSDFRYSTYGYTLLSAVMEAAAGRPFLELMDELLFVPLGMQHTAADDRLRPHPDRAADYIAVIGRSVLTSPRTNSSNKWAGGGFLSTPSDLARFGAALLDDRVIDPASRETMFEPRTTTDGAVNTQRYGLGWREGRMTYPVGSGQTVRFLHHGGTSVGAQCALVLVPESRVVVAISANAYTGGSGQLIQAAAEIARDFMPSSSRPVAPGETSGAGLGESGS